jgi:PhnB protein
MGSNALGSMGFNVVLGNNFLINLEPDTGEETKRLFEALSCGGNITLELKEMFWGVYYGSCTDKFGIQGMFNCIEN